MLSPTYASIYTITHRNSLKIYMVVNFRVYRINRGARKLAQTSTLNYKKKITHRNLKNLKVKIIQWTGVTLECYIKLEV